jgi:hypothetical protein
LPQPTLYEALASHLLWLEAAVGPAERDSLRPKVAAMLSGFARARHDSFLDHVARVVLAGWAAREKAVRDLKSAVPVGGYNVLIASVTDRLNLGPHLKAMEKAYSVTRTLSPIDTAAQCLLLSRLGELCR